MVITDDPHLPIGRTEHLDLDYQEHRDVTEIVISQGGGSDIPPGVYPVVLSSISEPRTVTATRGPNAGKDVTLLDWTFIVVDGPYADTELQASTSTASGPKSKLYGFLTALFGGVPPQIGSRFQTSALTGRMALATVSRTEDGWPRIENLGAMPPQMLAQQFAQATGASAQAPAPAQPPAAAPQPAPVAAAPAQPVASPIRDQVAAQVAPNDGLPF